MSKHKPLTCKEVRIILDNLGFEPQPQNGTSHQHWKCVKSGKMYKVTLDCPKAPFGQDLISSMAKQAGVSKRQFYKALDKKFKKTKPQQA